MSFKKQCKYCGEKFIAFSNGKIYCSAECKSAALKIVRLKIAKPRPKKKKGSTHNSIVEIQKRAQAEGLTYGQYVAKYNL